MDYTGKSYGSDKKARIIYMTELEKTKYEAINSLKKLCARCNQGIEHVCPVRAVIQDVQSIHGVPVIVNEQLRHVVFN